MRIHIPQGLDLSQTLLLIHEHTAAHAPTLFAAEMQRQLAGHHLLANFRTTMGKTNGQLPRPEGRSLKEIDQLG